MGVISKCLTPGQIIQNAGRQESNRDMFVISILYTFSFFVTFLQWLC